MFSSTFKLSLLPVVALVIAQARGDAGAPERAQRVEENNAHPGENSAIPTVILQPKAQIP